MTTEPDEVTRYVCGGFCLNGRPCRRILPSVRAKTPGNCHQHRNQPVRAVPRCLFNTQTSDPGVPKVFFRCTKAAVVVPTEPTRLLSCAKHHLETPFLRICMAEVVSENGQQMHCGQEFRWLPPSRELCPLHQEPDPRLPRPIGTMPKELIDMVLCHLRPVDRVAFALSSKVYARHIEAWAQKPGKVTGGKVIKIFHRLSPPWCGPEPLWNETELGQISSPGRDFFIPRGTCDGCNGWNFSDFDPPMVYEVRRPLDPFTRAARDFPFLFGTSTSRLCMACHTPLGTAFGGPPNRQDFLCRHCLAECNVYVKYWCDRCDGQMDAYLLSRLYWLTQSTGPTRVGRSFWYRGGHKVQNSR